MPEDQAFARDVLNASLLLMSILVAVITIVAVEYRSVQGDSALANPLWAAVVGATIAAMYSGVLSLIALVNLRLGRGGGNGLAVGFGILIVAAIIGIGWVASALLA